ncbi:MAG: beta-galactosidase, partial [Verrucomicrobiota bacterium]
VPGATTGKGGTIHIDDLLAPVQIVEDVVCSAPDRIDFTAAKNDSWRLRGSMPNKSCTVVLRPEEGMWDISEYSYFRVDLVNTGPGLVWIQGRLDNAGAKDWANSTSSAAFIMPGEQAVLGFAYPRSAEANDAPAIFDRQSGKPNGHRTHWKPFNPERVKACRLVIRSTSSKLSLEQIKISMAQPYGAEANAGLLELPYLDRFGQVRQLDWAGKLHAEKELALRNNAEKKACAADPGPAAFNRYGGWDGGPQLEATGFFRTEKRKGKWWLVDPDGRLFFSHGSNSIGFGQRTPVKGREALFEWLPSEDDPLMEGVLEKSRMYFMKANLARTFGAEWQAPARDRLHRRLRRWGMNTLGAWSDAGLVKDRKTPYTAILHIGNKYSALGHGISDPFSEEFLNNLNKRLGKILGPEGKDPWCIGVFIDNEIDWTEPFVHKAFNADPQQSARMAAVEWLKQKYETVEDLNKAWGTDYPSWDGIGELPESTTGALDEDISDLKRLIAGEYYKACRDAMRKVLPNHLYLGSRMHKAPAEVMQVAAEYVDVLSLNSYEPLSGSKVPPGADVPCLDTEFHFAAPDRGVPGTGLRPVGDQIQRSRSYVAYVVGGLLHPNMVGTHWFAHADQSAAGRPGENHQIGFVDVTDTPYPIMTGACRTMAERMYELRATGPEDVLEALESLWSGE